MEIKKCFNSSKKGFNKNFNIVIGISVGNKWFTKNHLREYLEFSLKNTKGKVLFLIADKIQAINYGVRNKSKSKKMNLRRALKKGEEMKKILLELIQELPKRKKEKVEILQWEEYERKDKFWRKYTPVVYSEFEKNKQFQKKILNIVKSTIQDKDFLEEDYFVFSRYLLEEFVFTYSGLEIEGEYFGAYLYPTISPNLVFVEKIQKKKLFLELNEKLPKEKVALAIVS